MKLTIEIPDDMGAEISERLRTMVRTSTFDGLPCPPPLTLTTLVGMMIVGAHLSFDRPGHPIGARMAEFLELNGYKWF